RISITGPPGAGKSTFIDSFGNHLAAKNKKIAILTIDPSSPQSGGSILGDKTRMDQLINHDHVYIRPSASGTEQGGVSSATMESILLCEMAGYDYVIVETVGVGQSEIAVSELVDMYILIVQPGSGDDLQGIKRGIMELADLYIVNKADGDKIDLAKQSGRSIDAAKSLLFPKKHGLKAQTILYSSETLLNIEKIEDAIDAFFVAINDSDFYNQRRSEQLASWLQREINKSIIESVTEIKEIQEIKSSLQNQIKNSEAYPIEAGAIIKKTLKELFNKS
ncbi:UNVERIFIED_CONTAM: hypothetical protein GTU68_048366, partial [Idotea baltica]|nr:hypothetical protein [Idotea baltica]